MTFIFLPLITVIQAAYTLTTDTNMFA